MVRLRILSGQTAGAWWVARRFPVRIGRSATDDLTLEDPGVWERHLELDFLPAEGFRLRVRPEALARVNGQPVEQALLRNGDRIEVGGATVQFWLDEVRQARSGWRESLTWVGIALVCLGQVFLVYWLLR